MEKSIIIKGKQNRYLMKKVLKQNLSTERVNMDFDETFFDYEFQKKCLNDEKSECYRTMTNHINKKIESYRNQDKLKNRKTDIDLNDVLKMFDQPLCCYCNENILILYKLKLEPKQWTLDRIDNDFGHEKGNVVLSCLKCNLERRCKNKDKFDFTKKMKIVKI